MATLHATALFFSKDGSQNLGRLKAVRVARPFSQHDLQAGGCLGMAKRATFDEYCKAWRRFYRASINFRGASKMELRQDQVEYRVLRGWMKAFATDL